MTRVIGLRVTDAEYERLAALARRQHVPLAAWARARLLQTVNNDPPTDSSQDELVAIREEQERTLAETRLVLREARALHAKQTFGKKRKHVSRSANIRKFGITRSRT